MLPVKLFSASDREIRDESLLKSTALMSPVRELLPMRTTCSLVQLPRQGVRGPWKWLLSRSRTCREEQPFFHMEGGIEPVMLLLARWRVTRPCKSDSASGMVPCSRLFCR
ncbi:hypothetical protein Mapa_013636 [Marchantia paleacea]|nr:hypothetical protein Mapa_013636 [Marchantia paleacea]